MSFLPDPGELRAIAERISGHATATRARAFGLGGAVAAVDWHGLAASAFRSEAHAAISGLRGAGGRLDDAADALREHAARVAQLYDDVKALGIDGFQTAEDIVLRPDRLLSDSARLVADGKHLFGDALSLLGF